jgi:DNA-binding beta-propeller fold protein YncE
VVQNGRLANGDLAVLGYSPDGKVISSLGQSSASGGLSNPAGVAIDTDGNAFVTVPDYGWVCQFRTAGSFRAEFGLDGRGALRFPLGIAVDAQGRIFVADSGNSRIVHFGVAL